MTTNPKPKRHHYVSKFYLRNFANRKRRIRMYARGRESEPIVTSVTNAAVEAGLYTLTDTSGEKSYLVENYLAEVEGSAKESIDRLLKGEFPVTDKTRIALAFFIAFQTVRTPEHRRKIEVGLDYEKNRIMGVMTAEKARDFLVTRGIEPTEEAIAEIVDAAKNRNHVRYVPTQVAYIKHMLSEAVDIAQKIYERSWSVGRCSQATLITSDHPVVWYTQQTESSPWGIHVWEANEVHLPLNKHRVLMLAPPGTPEVQGDLGAKNVLFINSLEAGYSHKWIYQHPDDDRVDSLVPAERKALMEVDGEELFENEEYEKKEWFPFPLDTQDA